MFDISSYRKAKVIKETLKNGTLVRETVIDGIAVRENTAGVFIFDPKEQKTEQPAWAEWFPYKSNAGVKTIVYG